MVNAWHLYLCSFRRLKRRGRDCVKSTSVRKKPSWTRWLRSAMRCLSVKTLMLVSSRNLSTHINMHTYAGNTLGNLVIFYSFDVRISAWWGPAIRYICVPSLVLIAQVVFLFEYRHNTQTHKVTDATDHPTHTSPTARVDHNLWTIHCESKETFVITLPKLAGVKFFQ